MTRARITRFGHQVHVPICLAAPAAPAALRCAKSRAGNRFETHFGEKIIRISPALSKNADFEYRCENEFASGILTLDRTFCIKNWISLLEDAFRNDRVLSFQQSGCANKRKKLARRQRTAQNRFLARVSLYSTCEKTSIFSVPCTCIRPAR